MSGIEFAKFGDHTNSGQDNKELWTCSVFGRGNFGERHDVPIVAGEENKCVFQVFNTLVSWLVYDLFDLKGTMKG